MIRLVVGLGNPGKEYERTRHNAGFWLLERFASASGVALRKDPKFQALVGRHEPTGAWLLEPYSARGRVTVRLFDAGSSLFIRTLGRFTGVETLQELAELLSLKGQRVVAVDDLVVYDLTP